jgi:hypothetical protein
MNADEPIKILCVLWLDLSLAALDPVRKICGIPGRHGSQFLQLTNFVPIMIGGLRSRNR